MASDPNFTVPTRPAGDSTNAAASTAFVTQNTIQRTPTTDFYVSATGSDSNNGLTPSTAFLTIGHALAVATGYDIVGTSVAIIIGAGTFEGAVIAGALRGAANASPPGSISGQYIYFIGAGISQTVIQDTLGRAFVFEVSNGATATFNEMNILVGTGKVGVFVQNPGSVAQLGASIAFQGVDNTASALHVEAYGLIEMSTGTLELYGTFNTFAAMGPCGMIELDPGAGGTINCNTGVTFQQFVFIDAGATFQLGTGWSITTSGGVTGIPAFIVNGGVFYNQAGATLPGNSNIIIERGGRYIPEPAPTVFSAIGLGTGGTAAVAAGSTSYGGTIVLTTGSASTADAGVVTLTMPVNNLMASSVPAPVVGGLAQGNTGWLAGSLVEVTNSTPGTLVVTWSQGSTALTINTTYNLNWACNN